MLEADVSYAGRITGTGANYVINYKAQNNVLPALYWLQAHQDQATASIADTRTTLSGIKDTLAAGSVLLKGLSRPGAEQIAARFGLDLLATNAASFTAQHQVALPKVAIYHTWYSTQDAGWARYSFEQTGIPYTSINKDDLKSGNLKSRFDVILVPNTSGNAGDFINEIDKKFGPMPYTKTSAFPSHGFPDSTQDMTGGPGFQGMENLRQFAEAGGIIISLDNASNILATAGITNDLQPVDAAGLFHPGSIVQVKARKKDNPVLYGFPEFFPVFKGNGPLLQVRKYNRDMMLLQYGTKPLKDEEKYTGPILGMPSRDSTKTIKEEPKKELPYVLSGMVRNEQTIIGHGSIFNVPVGKGRLIAFTFDPLHRYLNLHDAPLVWNVLMNWNHL
jgi:hypothetical protein